MTSSQDLRGAKGVQVNRGNGIQLNIFHWPRGVQRAVVALIVLALIGAGTFTVIHWVLPQFAPTYKTQFLVDASQQSGLGLEAVSASLGTVVSNSGDSDALALRSFGGECGDATNTTQHVDFGTDNRQEIAHVAERLAPSGRATLQRGIVEAIADFSRPFSRHAKQVNRIIVVTGHGTDGCDSDADFVEREIKDRLEAAGLTIEFRFIGFQVDDRDRLDRIASGVGKQEPIYTESDVDLQAALDWVTNVEPVLRNAEGIRNILNPTVDQLNRAVNAIGDGRPDVAERALERARSAIDATDLEFEDLNSRAKTDEIRDMNSRARRLRDQQEQVADAVDQLADAARSAEPLSPHQAAFEAVANAYNDEVNGMNDAIAKLRAKFPGRR